MRKKPARERRLRLMRKRQRHEATKKRRRKHRIVEQQVAFRRALVKHKEGVTTD